MILNEQQRQMGKDNFSDALKLTRRELLPALVTLPAATAFYWGYERFKGNPVRAALIGAPLRTTTCKLSSVSTEPARAKPDSKPE